MADHWGIQTLQRVSLKELLTWMSHCVLYSNPPWRADLIKKEGAAPPTLDQKLINVMSLLKKPNTVHQIQDHIFILAFLL